MEKERYVDFIIDLIPLIIMKLNKLSHDDAYELGKAMAYYDVLNTMKSRAEMLDIPLKDIGLDNICLEDLVQT